MNKNQAVYQIGRVVVNNYDAAFFTIALEQGYESIDGFLHSHFVAGVLNGAISLYAAYYGLLCGASRSLSYQELKKINTMRESCPLEHSEKIFIDDAKGLEFLLSKTREREKREWGTLLKAHDHKGTAVVDGILDIPKGKELGLIGEGTLASMSLACIRADEEGYNGYHHYHTTLGLRWPGTINFSISPIDRFKPLNWINFLTFNLPEGPEIVGFNRQYTYIPADRSKRELVRATPRQIMEYLGQ